MNALQRLFSSTGQERRAWLDRQNEAIAEGVNYYLGPHLGPTVNALSRIAPEFSNAADFRDAYDYGGRAGEALRAGDYFQAAQDAAQSAAATGAIAIPGVSAAALRGGVSKADEIARLLREGRADEVTDDMLGALTPQDEARLFELYEQGATGMDLPMDAVSRAARAEGMGFDPEMNLYHGTGANIDAFNASGGAAGHGVYFGRQSHPSFEAKAQDIANRYANKRSSGDRDLAGEGANVVPAYGPDEVAFYQNTSPEGLAAPAADMAGPVRLVRDPSRIRSRFARFDPRLAHLRNLSAAGLGVAAGAGALRDYVYDDEGNPQPGGAY